MEVTEKVLARYVELDEQRKPLERQAGQLEREQKLIREQVLAYLEAE